MSTYIILHNLYIITKDKFNTIQIEEVKVKLKKHVEDDIVNGGQALRDQQTSIEETKSQVLKFEKKIQNSKF